MPFLAGLAFFVVSLVVITMLHEVGHAVAVKSFGRSVLRGGFAIQNGFPGLWIDTQDIWMEPRGARIAVSWAGPYSGFILAGLTGIVLTIAPGGAWSQFARLFGLAALVGNAIQLLPLVRLDGYYILMDWLDIPNLRARSLIFIRYDLMPKLLHRQRLTHEEWIFATFGVLALLYSAGATLLLVWILWMHAPEVIGPLLHARSLQDALAAGLVIVLAVPFLAITAVSLIGMAQSILRAARRSFGVARVRWYRERATLLSQVPWLDRLGNTAIEMLASQLKEERRPAGATIVRQGDPGDRFYLIVDGQASVSVETAGVSSVVAEVGPMDYFGERALIEAAPRAASVRAETEVRLLSLTAGKFRASLQQYVEADVALRSALDELAEMDRFPLLQPLGPQERQVLIRYLRPVTFFAGAEIVRQGEPADAFYLLRSGRAAVTRRDQTGAEIELQTLAAGEFFGEIGLLTELPRVATVRALEETRVWSLDAQSFQNLLGQYFNLGERLMPVARDRLLQDNLVAIAETEVLAEPYLGLPAPELALEVDTGKGVSLAGLRGRPVAVWFSRNRRDPSAALASAIAAACAAGLEFLRIVPDPPAALGPDLPVPGYPVLIDRSGSAFRAYGMYTRTAPEVRDDPWSSVMSGLSSEQSNRTDLLEIREGIALIGPDGLIEKLQPIDSENYLIDVLKAAVGVAH
jgi:putative peptide zinc metalloprotease protein